MDCPKCHGQDTHVLKSIPMRNGDVKRRRECPDCGFRFTTEEHVRLPVIKKDFMDGTKRSYP